jgi:hypothetical protein
MAANAVHVEDNHETSALEYAILSDASLQIVQLLQVGMVRKFKYKKRNDMPNEYAQFSNKRPQMQKSARLLFSVTYLHDPSTNQA